MDGGWELVVRDALTQTRRLRVSGGWLYHVMTGATRIVGTTSTIEWVGAVTFVPDAIGFVQAEIVSGN